MSDFSERLEKALAMRDMKPADLSKVTEIGEGAISQYRKGAYKATQRNLDKISKALNVPIPWLMGASDDMFATPLPSNVTPYTVANKAPIIGSIPAGYPVLAFEDIEGYADIPYADAEDYFFLRVNGESMKNAGIHTGDLVLIRRQSCADDGQVVAARVNGDEATLKRYKRQGNSILLLPENPDFEPRIVPEKDFETGDAEIIGVALEVRHTL